MPQIQPGTTLRLRSHGRNPSRRGTRAKGVAARLTSTITSVLAIVLLTVLLIVPVLAIIYGSFRSGAPSQTETHWTLEHYRAFGPTVIGSGVLRNSVILAVVSTALSLLIGGAFAFVAERTDVPARRLITPVMVVGLALFPTIRAMGWAMAGDPNVGAMNVLARSVTGNEDLTLVSTTGWFGVIFLVTLAGSQVCYFRLLGSFGRLNLALEEASLVAGRGRLQTLARVTVPLLLPVLGVVAIVAFIIDLQTFTEPYILGSKPAFMMPAIVNTIINASPPNYGPAGVLGAVTVAIALSLGALQALLSRGRDYETVQGRASSHSRIEVRRGRGWITAAVVIFALLAVGVPVASTVIASFTPYPGEYSHFTTAAYTRLFGYTTLLPSARDSLSNALIGAVVAVLIALIVALVRLRVRRKATAGAIAALLLIALGLPGVVQALGITWAYTTIPGIKALYGTNTLVLVALVVVALPILSQLLYGSLRQVSLDLEDAAVVAGSPRPIAFLRVTVPLLLPSLLSGWFIATLILFGNLEIPLLLGSPDKPMLMQLSYSLFSSGDRSGAAALTTLFLGGIALAGLIVLALHRLLTLQQTTRATARLQIRSAPA